MGCNCRFEEETENGRGTCTLSKHYPLAPCGFIDPMDCESYKAKMQELEPGFISCFGKETLREIRNIARSRGME